MQITIFNATTTVAIRRNGNLVKFNFSICFQFLRNGMWSRLAAATVLLARSERIKSSVGKHFGTFITNTHIDKLIMCCMHMAMLAHLSGIDTQRHLKHN